MGILKYDSTLEITVEDRLLAHLQIVIGAKLRRSESFYFTFTGADVGTKQGRVSIWIHPTVPLGYEYQDVEMPPINRQWLEALTIAANPNNVP